MIESNKNMDSVFSKIKKEHLYYVLVFFLFPAGLVFGVEYIQRHTLPDTFTWIMENKTQFYFSYFIILINHTLLFSIVGCMYISSALMGGVVLLFSIVSLYKIKFLGQPLFPWDLLINKEGLDMTRLVIDSRAVFLLCVVLLIFFSLIAARFFLPRMSIKLHHRIMLAATMLPLLFVLYYQPLIDDQTIYEKFGVTNIKWRQEQNYNANGTILAFSMNIKSIIITSPAGYSRDRIHAIIDHADSSIPASSSQESKNPNVIIVMNEAFWDPMVMDQLTFSEDPIPTFRKLQDKHPSGWLLSPQFGGGTANVEFEVLTGHSTSFLPSGSIPYQQYIKTPLYSLATYFKDHGYRSIGLHPYEGWFWARNTVYGLLGFDEFMSIESFKGSATKGPFIADTEVSKRIIAETEKSEQPMFIYTVTMQNHGPYEGKRYKEDNRIKISGNLSDQSRMTLENYTQGAADADESLRLLVEHYEQSDEPTIIVFFGDHLPVLGHNFSVYTESGFIHSGITSQWTLEELQKMRSVPVLIWSNYKEKHEEIPHLSTSFLGPYLLDYMEKEQPPYFSYLWSFSNVLPGYLDGLKLDAGQSLLPETPEEFKNLEKEYWLLQYDQMFGKNYLMENREKK